MNKECYDQFSVIYGEGEKTAIFLNTPEPSKVEERAVSTMSTITCFDSVVTIICSSHSF